MDWGERGATASEPTCVVVGEAVEEGVVHALAQGPEGVRGDGLGGLRRRRGTRKSMGGKEESIQLLVEIRANKKVVALRVAVVLLLLNGLRSIWNPIGINIGGTDLSEPKGTRNVPGTSILLKTRARTDRGGQWRKFRNNFITYHLIGGDKRGS